MVSPERRHRVVPADQVSVLIPLLLVWGGGVIVLWAILGTSATDDAQLLLDPAAASGMPWFTGLISNLGVLAWTLGAAAAAAAAHIAHLGERDRAARFLRHAAAIGALLTFDDLFQLHSSVFPDVFGLPKIGVVFVYGVIVAIWSLTHATEIVRSRWGLLFAAGVGMSLSIAVDQLSTGQDWALLAEDGAKFLGILAWAAYFTLTARDIALSVVLELRQEAPGRPDDTVGSMPRRASTADEAVAA